MSVLLKTTLFAVIVIAAFTLFSVYYIPDQKPVLPPKETRRDITTMDLDEIIATGRYVYGVKGECRRCHASVGKRAPELKSIAITAEERIKEAGYKGMAKTAAEYIYESMQYPSLYIVKSYGVRVKGDGDGKSKTKSPMPSASSRAVSLTETEMRATVVYLQDISGVTPTPFFELPEVPLLDKGADNAPAGNSNEEAATGR